jgi:5-methyltetrahydrofolate--homocysteine methyltransferase
VKKYENSEHFFTDEIRMKPSITDLTGKEFIVLDGGMGTFLLEQGLSAAELPEEWNLSHPETIIHIHRAYLDAGAQIIETNSFGATALKLQAKGKAHLVQSVNREAVRLACNALDAFMKESGVPTDPRYIGGSVGPTGKIFGMGLSATDVEKTYAEQGVFLADSGVDLLLVETMLDLREAEIVVRTLKRETNLPIFATAVFNKTKKGEYRTLFGDTVEDVVLRYEDAGAQGVGVNCGLIGEYVEVIGEMREQTRLPLLLYPNAGIPVLKDGKTSFNQTPDQMISYLDASIEAGATIIGGCCGTTPAYISLIANRIKGRPLKTL